MGKPKPYIRLELENGKRIGINVNRLFGFIDEAILSLVCATENLRNIKKLLEKAKLKGNE